MSETIPHVDPAPEAVAPEGAAPERPKGLHIGPYPVVLPKLSDPRLHVSFVTTTLQILGQTVFKFDISIAQILLTFGICMSIDIGTTFRRSKIFQWPASAMPTASGIALIMRVPGTEWSDWWSMNGWWVFAGTAVFAMASKHLIRVNGRHIFNPSNFALVVAFLVLGEFWADPQVLWWGPVTPGLVIAFVVILGGSVFITTRVGQGPMAVGFWVPFAVLMGVIALSGHSITANWHVGPISGWDYFWLLVISPEVLVFTFFMITDPKTTPRGRVGRMLFGISVATTAGIIIATQPREHGTKVGLLAALVVMCIFTQLIERWCPAPGSEQDRIRPWLRSVLVPQRRPDRAAVRFLSVAAVVLAILGTTFVLGGRDAADAQGAQLERRDEVPVPPTVPPVQVDAGSAGSATDITEAQAEQMATDLVHDLEIERVAYRDADAELAQAGLAGVRLEQARAGIAAGDIAPAEYSIDALVATFVRLEPGPQSPPELALRATGQVVRDGASGPLESTFVLRGSGDSFLLVTELDAEGEPIGEQLDLSGARPIEAPVDITTTGSSAADTAVAFREVTAQVGLDTYAGDPAELGAPPEGAAALQGGAAVADVDGDGDGDVFVTRDGAANVLLRNDDGRFVDVTEQYGLPTDTPQSSSAALWADVDGDLATDLVVAGLGRTSLQLYLRRGPVFVESAAQWGLVTASSNDPDTAVLGLAAADYDGDGRLDLMVTEDDPNTALDALAAAEATGGPCDPAVVEALGAGRGTTASRTQLLRNTGSGFEDRTAALGVDVSTLLPLAPRFVDLDVDGHPDLVLGGATCTTTVLMNDGNGGFAPSQAFDGLGVEHAGAVELLDVDGDGRLDLFTSGVAYPTESGECPLSTPIVGCSGNRVLRLSADGAFEDRTDTLGVGDGAWAWGAAAIDVDADGAQDLAQVGGLRSARARLAPPEERPFWSRTDPHRPRLWRNAGADTAWPDVAESAGLPDDVDGRALVPFDYDGDGRVDLLVVGQGGRPRLFRNETATSNTSLAVRVTAEASAPLVVGTRIEVHVDADDAPQTRVVTAEGSFQGGGSTAASFGLGQAATADVVRVTWPDGHVRELRDVPAGELLVGRHGA